MNGDPHARYLNMEVIVRLTTIKYVLISIILLCSVRVDQNLNPHISWASVLNMGHVQCRARSLSPLFSSPVPFPTWQGRGHCSAPYGLWVHKQRWVDEAWEESTQALQTGLVSFGRKFQGPAYS